MNVDSIPRITRLSRVFVSLCEIALRALLLLGVLGFSSSELDGATLIRKNCGLYPGRLDLTPLPTILLLLYQRALTWSYALPGATLDFSLRRSHASNLCALIRSIRRQPYDLGASGATSAPAAGTLQDQQSTKGSESFIRSGTDSRHG